MNVTAKSGGGSSRRWEEVVWVRKWRTKKGSGKTELTQRSEQPADWAAASPVWRATACRKAAGLGCVVGSGLGGCVVLLWGTKPSLCSQKHVVYATSLFSYLSFCSFSHRVPFDAGIPALLPAPAALSRLSWGLPVRAVPRASCGCHWDSCPGQVAGAKEVPAGAGTDVRDGPAWLIPLSIGLTWCR